MATNGVPTLATVVGDADSLVVDLRTFADETRIGSLVVTVPEAIRGELGRQSNRPVDDAALIDEYVISAHGTPTRMVATTGGDDPEWIWCARPQHGAARPNG